MYRFLNNISENFNKEQNRWSLWVPVLFGAGIGIYFLLPGEISIWWSLALIELMIVLAVWFRYNTGFLTFLAIFSMVVLGFADIQLKAAYLNGEKGLQNEEKLYVSGRIEKIGFNYRGNQRLILSDATNFDRNRDLGTVRVSLRSKSSPFKVGECVEMVAQLMPLSKPVLPGGYQFDRKAYFEGLDASGYAISEVLPIDCMGEPSFSNRFRYAVDELRGRIIRHIRSVLPSDQASVTAAIVAGEQGVISRKIIQNYRDSGLAHFLSISGLHMTMIAGLMFFLVRLVIAFVPPLALRCDSKKISAVFAILISVFYLFISGAEIPAQRAFIMNFIVVLGIMLGRRAISMKTISLAALLVLVFTPQALIGASFQMSFAAVIALIAFYEKYAGSLHRFLSGNDKEQTFLLKTVKIVWVYIAGILVSDLVASLATMPFAVYHFNKISVYTTLANLLAGPVIGLVIMPFVLIALLLMPLGLDYWPLRLVGWGIGLVNDITAYVASLPNAGYQVLSMPLWGLLFIVFGGLWLCLWQEAWRKWGWLLVAAGMFSIFTVRVPDVIVDAEADLLAVKDNQGELVILPSRGNYFAKQMWLEKTANKKLDDKKNKLIKKIYKGATVDKKWLDLECNDEYCLYKRRIKYFKDRRLEVDGKPFDASQAAGAVFYLDGEKVKVKTVRDDIGVRYWNSVVSR